VLEQVSEILQVFSKGSSVVVFDADINQAYLKWSVSQIDYLPLAFPS
jgi:hypothetical protein